MIPRVALTLRRRLLVALVLESQEPSRCTHSTRKELNISLILSSLCPKFKIERPSLLLRPLYGCPGCPGISALAGERATIEKQKCVCHAQ